VREVEAFASQACDVLDAWNKIIDACDDPSAAPNPEDPEGPDSYPFFASAEIDGSFEAVVHRILAWRDAERARLASHPHPGDHLMPTPLPTFVEIFDFAGLKAYEHHTGGGCMAVVANLPDGRVAVATDDGGSRIDPQSADDGIMLGLYEHAQWYGDESGENAPVLYLTAGQWAAAPSAAIRRLRSLDSREHATFTPETV
jgi:hypothetical protein